MIFFFLFYFFLFIIRNHEEFMQNDGRHSKNHNEGIFTNGWASTPMSTLFPLLSLRDVHRLKVKWWTILRGRKDSISLQCNYTRLSGNNYRVVLIFYKLRINGIRKEREDKKISKAIKVSLRTSSQSQRNRRSFTSYINNFAN